MSALPGGLVPQARRAVPPPLIDEKGPIERLVLSVGHLVGERALKMLLRAALANLNVALCLHRVRDEGPVDWLAVAAEELDALIELLRASRPGDQRWLTVSFDDGYDDAARYVQSRAPRWPDVEWLLFVCPARAEQRLAFWWDDERGGDELATLEALREMQRLPGVALGNHTNSHVPQHTFTVAQASAEYEASFADFARLFGGREHFAFPYGTPGVMFGADHVEQLRRHGAGLIWSTERRPYRSGERHRGAVLPRFPVNGTWSHRQIALWLGLLALKYRCVGTPFRY